jgi:hypothetical protein
MNLLSEGDGGRGRGESGQLDPGKLRQPRCQCARNTVWARVGVWSVVLVSGYRKERVVLSVLSLHPTSAAQQRLFVHTQISLCNYTLTLSPILRKRRITSISQQHFHNQRVCFDH